MTELSDAIGFYHSLLTDELGQQSQAQLSRQLHHRQLFFGERPLCTVLRPRFMTTSHYQGLTRAIREIMPAFARAHRAAMADADFRRQFGLNGWEEELLQVDPGFRDPSPTARMDSFITTDETGAERIYFAEYNAETPAAVAYNDVLSEVMRALPVMGTFQRRYEVRPLPARHQVLHALLDAYHQWGGRDRPTIAILDWREVPTYSEFMLFQEYFKSQDYECVIADPRQLEYRNGELLVDGVTPVHLIYKRVLISELVQRQGLGDPTIRAVRDCAVCMVNPFRCKLLHKKASFAVLSDERNADLFTAEERQAIDSYIPWTRNVAERRTVFHGQTVDLLPFIAENRERLVLKPNDEYGGKGVMLGWDTSAEDWQATIQAALNEPYIVQERIQIPSEPYPSLVDGQVQIYDRLTDTNPYIWYGEYLAGSMTRLSTVNLLNVTAGGGSLAPTFVIEKRS